MGANDQTYTLGAVAPKRIAGVAPKEPRPPQLKQILHFPTVPMEDAEAELWLAAHDRLVKAAHAADKYLACSAIFKWKIDFDCQTLKEFRAAVSEIKDREARDGR